MYPDLAGKTAIVTGASKGIGKGIAERFGKEKMNVVVDYHTDAEGANDTVEKIQESGGQAVAIEADVSTESGIRKLVEAAHERFGSIDVLVNNAGFGEHSPTEELTLELWQRIIDVNLTGAFIASREALKYMLDNDIKGSIINITSVHQTIPQIEGVPYSVSKAGLKMMTEALALEYAERGIRINAVGPGTIQTPANPTDKESPEEKEKTLKKIPMKQIGHPDQIASAVAWLASSEADYVTGASLFVDAGMTLYPSQLG